MDERSVFGNNDIDDVRWLCSLSGSELDLLIGLRGVMNMRAKQIGHEHLAKKFDWKMLRALSFCRIRLPAGGQKTASGIQLSKLVPILSHSINPHEHSQSEYLLLLSVIIKILQPDSPSKSISVDMLSGLYMEIKNEFGMISQIQNPYGPRNRK